jgi:hypothetical protein
LSRSAASLLQFIRPRRFPPGQDGEMRAPPVLIKTSRCRAPLGPARIEVFEYFTRAVRSVRSLAVGRQARHGGSLAAFPEPDCPTHRGPRESRLAALPLVGLLRAREGRRVPEYLHLFREPCHHHARALCARVLRAERRRESSVFDQPSHRRRRDD